ncbi:TetR/AcrR family transcriptional regulator [Caproiciproducens sp. NJN-50]|uniref:TetR/AcrR family transcriptional regulator n=1 Tax=Acutalibacteraceae TaxID=3082771 RepID=UPI000FFE2B67|nr:MULTISPECIES: TetR/AcrR family transcriptional regulator [Acutalibacteraceae]QAT50178.1 TetR/AcrR family transcriptional regulator [Caproiciproducens sp. NJN-50]
MNREERKKEYLRSFIQTFSENGIDRTPIKKLAGAAKINEASIYQYFKNKDEIVVDCVRLYMEEELSQLLQVLAEEGEPLETRMDRFVQLSSKTSAEAKFIIQVLTSPNYSKMCSQIIHEFSRKILSSPQVGLEKGAFPHDTEESAVLLLLLSVVISDRVIGEDYLLRIQLEYLQHLLYNGNVLNRECRNSA